MTNISSEKVKTHLLWGMFCFWVAIALVTNLIEEILPDSVNLVVLQNIFHYFPLLILCVFVVFAIGFFRGTAFFLLCCLIGAFFEFFGLQHGFVFGSQYVYHHQGFKILSVPFYVILYWGGFIVLAYLLSNSFLIWKQKDKPSKSEKNIGRLVSLILLDGIAVVAIDILLDPVSVYEGNWSWLESGPFFGIPLGNFSGWFLTAIVASGLFRGFEYVFPKEQKSLKDELYHIPVLGYLMLCLGLTLRAVLMDKFWLALIGFSAMCPLPLLSLLLYFRRKQKKRVA